MKQKLVSIVVLTYKNLSFLEDCLNSIFEQDYEKMEIIVNDDGSEDFDKLRIEKYFEKKGNNILSFVVNQNIRNVGTVKNFNNAIDLCKGEYIIPLSVDDRFYDSSVVNKIVKCFEENDALICTAKREVVDENNKFIEVLPKQDEFNLLNEDLDVLYNVLAEYNFISGASTYYSRKVFEKLGKFNEDFILLEDYPFYLKAILNNIRIYPANFISIKYRLGGVSSQTTINPLLFKDFKTVYDNIVFKNVEKISNQKYRNIRLRYYRDYYKDDKLKLIYAHCIYLDRVILKALKKHFRRD